MDDKCECVACQGLYAGIPFSDEEDEAVTMGREAMQVALNLKAPKETKVKPTCYCIFPQWKGKILKINLPDGRIIVGKWVIKLIKEFSFQPDAADPPVYI